MQILALLFWTFVVNSSSLWVQSSISMTSCPDGCFCSLASVVCSCDEAGAHKWDKNRKRRKGNEKSLLILDSLSDSIDYTKQFIVHSCDHVVIYNNTFIGLSIIEQIKFVDIGRIEFYPNAFRGIRKSPRQFVIQNSHVHLLAGLSLAGLSSIDHFWFRNVTIERISRLAFSKLSNIKYLYFREVSIEVIEAGAFAHMKGIQHFYMREKIHISSISDHIFVGSRMNEVIFENAQIRSTDLSFVGINAKQVSFINCKIHSQKRSHLRRIAIQTVENFQATNCSFNRLVLSMFYNFSSVLFEDSKIGHISAFAQSSSNFAAFNIRLIHFQRCSINQWHSYVFNSARNIGLVVFKDSRILAFYRNAIFNSHINQLLFQSTRIKSIEAEAFPNNFLGSVKLDEVEVPSIGVGAFSNTNILGTFLIQRANVHSIQEAAFANMHIQQLIVSQSTFGNFPHRIFQGTNCSSLIIRDSKFMDYFNASIFTNMRTTRQLSVSHSQFMCSPSACEENSLLLHSSIHNLAWKFTNNQCIIDEHNNTEEVCVEEVQTYNANGLVCRRRGGSIEECICVENERRSSVQLPETTAAILVLGDCAKVVVDGPKHLVEEDNHFHSSRPNLQLLYLYRINLVEIESVEKSLKQLHLLYCTIHFNKDYALENIQLDELVISGSIVNHVAENTFTSSQIDVLTINGTTINHVDQEAFTDSHIELVELVGSKVVSAGNMFNFANRLRIEDSQLPGRPHNNPAQPILCTSLNCKCANSTNSSSCKYALGGSNITKRCANNNDTKLPNDCYDSLELVNRCTTKAINNILTACNYIIALTISVRFPSNIIFV